MLLRPKNRKGCRDISTRDRERDISEPVGPSVWSASRRNYALKNCTWYFTNTHLRLFSGFGSSHTYMRTPIVTMRFGGIPKDLYIVVCMMDDLKNRRFGPRHRDAV